MEQLRQQCLEEKVDKHAEAVKAYSALTQSPKEWTQEVSPPTSCHLCLLPHYQFGTAYFTSYVLSEQEVIYIYIGMLLPVLSAHRRCQHTGAVCMMWISWHVLFYAG